MWMCSSCVISPVPAVRRLMHRPADDVIIPAGLDVIRASHNFTSKVCGETGSLYAVSSNSPIGRLQPPSDSNTNKPTTGEHLARSDFVLFIVH